MACILVCDRCGASKDVHTLQSHGNADADLCGKCAFEMLASFAEVEDGADHLRDLLEALPKGAVSDATQPPPKPAAPPAPVVTVEDKARNLRNQLAVQHQADIFYVKIEGELASKPPCRVDYCGTLIEVLAEAPPNFPHGNYLAKKL